MNVSFKENKVIRDAQSTMTGTVRGIGKTLSDLRGTSKKATPAPIQNPYEKLEPKQFRTAMGAAYQNIVRMEHFGTSMPDSEKDKALAEIQKIMDVAAKRFPDAQPMDKGSYFTDSKLQNVESQLYGYMKEDAKLAKNPSYIMQDINRYEAWRQGKDFEMSMGKMNLAEEPFHNIAVFSSRDEHTFTATAEDYLYNPLRTARNVMSQNDVMTAKKQLESLKIR